ncbi:MAG: hypothetical protein ATN36_05180 [Epulopiscium sp. Nele67-Bin005]|nr:MAG: hypothetical protein ATN36_05180 [Epulopiscium sp. Nele67-Bin005]
MSKKLVIGLVGATLFIGGTSGFLSWNKNEEVIVQTIAMENVVELGDIIIGLSETGSITIPTYDVTFDYAVEVVEAHVKAGQQVSVGDVLFTITTDSIDDEIDALEDEIDKYNDEIDGYNDKIEGYEDQIDDYKDKIEDYYDQIDDYKDQIDDYYEQIENYYKQIENYEKQITKYYTSISDLEEDIVTVEKNKANSEAVYDLEVEKAILTYSRTLSQEAVVSDQYSLSAKEIEQQIINLEYTISSLEDQKEEYEALVLTYAKDYAKLDLLEIAMDEAEEILEDKQYALTLYDRENSINFNMSEPDATYESIANDERELYSALVSAQAQRDALYNAYIADPSNETLASEYSAARTAYTNAYNAWNSKYYDYIEARENYADSLAEYKANTNLKNEYWDMVDEISDLQDAYDDAKVAYSEYELELNSNYYGMDDEGLEQKIIDLEYSIADQYLNYEKLQQSVTTSEIDTMLGLAEFNLDLAQAQVTYENTIDGLQDTLDNYDKQIANLYDDIEDIKDNIDSTRDDISTVQSNISKAERNISNVQKSIESTQKNITSTQADIVKAQVNISDLNKDIASVRVDIAEVNAEIKELDAIRKTGTIVADRNATVAGVTGEEGSSYNANVSLATLTNPDDNTYISVTISEDDINSIYIGQPANITMSAFDNAAYKGYVDSISYTAARSGGGSVSYYVYIKVEGDTENFFEGMSSTVTFIQESSENVITVSTRTLITEGRNTFVKVKDPETGEGTLVQVETGLTDTRNIEITNGLNVGDIVLIESQVTGTTSSSTSSSSGQSSAPSGDMPSSSGGERPSRD